MGWDFTHRERGHTDTEWLSQNLAEGYTVLKAATVGSTWYAAVQTPEGDVTAFVTLIKRVPRDYFNFGKKDMSEDWGPTEARCPDAILDLLTETQDPHAKAWRARCREHNALIAKVKKGSVLEHAGTRYVAVDLRRNLFRSQSSGVLLRWSWWRSSDAFEVVG